ncbi:hypothetical protein [Haloechinothrix halophila]|uniref:hypothetical protein n=1 Tax=Haloechinothrix halophila TaxID=1069073 RepID=UPI00040746D4|nr:hypothetical protein [Haloechinothrix halophila]
MDELHEPKSAALRALFWRDEILQLMFWVKGEGFGDAVDAELLERFLGVRAEVGLSYLDRLVDEGLIERDAAGRYQLTPTGHEQGARVFAAEFAEITQPAHGECGADCWCHMSVDEAEACLAERGHPVDDRSGR